MSINTTDSFTVYPNTVYTVPGMKRAFSSFTACKSTQAGVCSGFGALALHVQGYGLNGQDLRTKQSMLHVHVIFHCTKKEADAKTKYLTQSYTNYQELELEWEPSQPGCSGNTRPSCCPHTTPQHMYVLLLVEKIQNKVFQTSIIKKKKDKIIQTCQQSLGSSVKTFSSVPFKIMNRYSSGNS